MDPSLRRYLVANGAIAVFVAGLGLWSINQGDLAGGLVLLAAVVVASWWAWPHRGPHLDEEEARRRMEPGDVIVFWRPGCVHCARLTIASRLARWPNGSPRRLRVNVWRDPDAATTVRLLRDGFETVPTVVDADDRLIEPTPGGIRARRPLAGAPRP